MSKAFEQPLYHGTVEMIPRIDVTRGRFKKDFGRGFYMALQPKQAVGMMHKKFAEAVKRSRGKDPSAFVKRLYKVQLKPSAEASLSVKIFAKADMEWLDFILANREAVDHNAHSYDVVIGPTADDDTVIALQNYWKGIYGKVGSFEAKNALLHVLEVENLGTQCCLCTEMAVEVGVMTFGPVDWRSFS